MIKYIDRKRQIIKSIYTGIGKRGVIYPISFLVAIAQGIITLGIIFYLKEHFNATPPQVGFIAAAWALSYITGCLFFRPLSDRILPRYILISSSFAKFILITLIIHSNNLAGVFILYSLYGFIIAFFWPPLVGWLSQETEGQKLGRIMSRYNFSWSLGTIISPLLAGQLSQLNVGFPLRYGSLIYLFSSVLLIIAATTMPKIKEDRTTNVPDVSHKFEDNSTPMRFPAWFGIFTTYTVIGVILNIFPLFAMEDLKLNKGTVGILLQMRAISSTIGFITLGRLTFWHFRFSQMVAGQLILGVVVFFMITTSNPVIIAVLIFVIGFCMALNYSNSAFHGISGSVNRAKRMAIHESLISSGLILGSSMGGLIYQKFTMQMLFILCSGFVLFGAFVQWTLYLTLVSKKLSFCQR